MPSFFGHLNICAISLALTLYSRTVGLLKYLTCFSAYSVFTLYNTYSLTFSRVSTFFFFFSHLLLSLSSYSSMSPQIAYSVTVDHGLFNHEGDLHSVSFKQLDFSFPTSRSLDAVIVDLCHYKVNISCISSFSYFPQ